MCMVLAEAEDALLHLLGHTCEAGTAQLLYIYNFSMSFSHFCANFGPYMHSKNVFNIFQRSISRFV